MTYRQFFTVRVVVGILLAVIVLWGLWAVLSIFEKDQPAHVVMLEEDEHLLGLDEAEELLHPADIPPIDEHLDAPHEVLDEEPSHELPHEESQALPHKLGHGMPEMETPHELKANGVAFVEAMTSALNHELNQRAWGWRCNDMMQFTDNVENIQLGVLEVVRRATVVLTERIARHGATDIIDKNLENAMNWFMIRPDQYWLPAPESRYNDALNELRIYAEKLERGEARFYTRADSLIPLLTSFSELLGGCDENLVKSKEEDGSPVKWSKVDDYLYYAKGVATAIHRRVGRAYDWNSAASRVRGEATGTVSLEAADRPGRHGGGLSRRACAAEATVRDQVDTTRQSRRCEVLGPVRT